MAVERLYREVLLLLLASPSDEGCRKDTREIYHHLGQKKCRDLGLRNVDQLDQYLQNCTRLFEVEFNGRNAVSVFPKTTLTICRTHSNKGGSCPDGTCPDLHFCMFFLLSGECRFGGGHCHFGHELGTHHNHQLLQRHLLWGLNITDLRALFCLPEVRRGVTLPRICKYYNVNKGCSKGAECRSLHLCLYYVLEQCKFAKHCGRNHEINHPQVTNVLTLYGVKVKGRKLSDILHEVRLLNQKHEAEAEDEEPIHRSVLGVGARSRRSGSVPDLLRGQQISLTPRHGASQRAPSVGRRSRTVSETPYSTLAGPQSCKTEEICLYFLKGLCRFKENCNLLHSADPYLWRLTSSDTCADHEGGSEWRELPHDSNRMLEEVYSQPQEMVCTVTDQNGAKLDIDFRMMTAQNKRTGQQYRVRRVSTPSSVDPSMKSGRYGNFHLATVWVWHWKNQQGIWSQFGAEKNGKLPVTSVVVEENYHMNGSAPMKFDHFVLDFGTMRLRDIDTGRKFKVRRRPLFMLQNHSAESCSVDWRSDSEDSDAERGTCNEDDDDDKDDEARAMTEVPVNNRRSGERAKDVSSTAISADKFLSPVHASSQDFMSMKGRFTGTLDVSCTVISIHRVKNPKLKARYKKMRSSVTTKSHKERIREVKLYYGPSLDEDIHAIYTNGVNCENSGLTFNGTTLGKEGYFHVTANRANKSIGSEEERCMFVMKCLVPHTPLVAPPSAVSGNTPGRGSECYVDDASYPKTYIISNPRRVCPIYMITYRLS